MLLVLADILVDCWMLDFGVRAVVLCCVLVILRIAVLC